MHLENTVINEKFELKYKLELDNYKEEMLMLLRNDTKFDMCIKINSNSIVLRPNEQLEMENQNVKFIIFPKVKTETKWLINF